jgi:hypothetical protein
MRAYLATAILMALTLTAAPSQQKQCKNHCDIDYNVCMRHSFTSVAKKGCKATRTNCKKGCPALR